MSQSDVIASLVQGLGVTLVLIGVAALLPWYVPLFAGAAICAVGLWLGR